VNQLAWQVSSAGGLPLPEAGGLFMDKKLDLTTIIPWLLSVLTAAIGIWRRLYWGPLGIVEDRNVEAAMVELGRVAPDKPVSTPSLPVKAHALPMKAHEQPSLRLAHAGRNLILARWRVDLPPLEGMRR
jgi:hypothetical protein